MDSYQNFVETLKQAITNRDYEFLKNALKNAQQFLTIISIEHLQTFLNNIFDIREGLLHFLELELANHCPNKYIDEALTEGYRFLDFLITHFHKDTSFKNYIDNIKDACVVALRVKSSYYIQKAACNAFMNLIEKFGNNDLELSDTVVYFVTHFHIVNQRERKLIFCVLGKIIKHSEPYSISTRYINIIYKQLCADSFAEDASRESLQQNFYMYFDALSDMWDCTEPPDDIKVKLSQRVYRWIKNVSSSERRQRFGIAMKSGIELLNRHMYRFQNFLYNDYKFWYHAFRSLSCERGTYASCGQSALKKLYRVIGNILREQNGEESKKIFEFFREEFLKEFENSVLDLIMLRLTVDGFSQMAASCKVYLSQHDTRKMYSTITNCALPLCSSEQCDSECIENVCCYLEALANILQYISNVTIEKINVLITLSIYIIKKFPELRMSKNALVVSALLKTIKNIGYVDEDLLQRYLDNIFYNGIAWSCSHTLALDAELQQELENLKQPPICYKNYLPLWIQLLNVNRYVDCEKLTQRVGNTLLNTCVMLISRLDIRVKRQEDIAFSDMALTRSAENQTDFRVFTNLVDLYVDMMNDESDPFFSVHSMHVFMREIIRLSYRYPLIPGFYKLIRVVLKIFDRVTKQQDEEEKRKNDLQTKELLSSYLVHTLDLIPTFSNELLIACLHLILDVPGIEYICAASIPIAHMIPIFKIAFAIGLSDLEFAYTALTALKTWSNYEELRKWAGRTNELLCEIVPYLESYLRSTESAVEVSQDLMRKTTGTAKVKRVNLIDTKYMLRNFQRQILLFLGSLGSDALSSFLHQRSLNTGASWDRKDLLRYTLPLPDMRLTIHFDRILPRIIALARDSSDRRTRIAACEVLHSMITLVIGSSMQHPSDLENSLYATLCPVLLTLGCDSDEVVCNLFQPLMLRLMRWLSSPRMLLSTAKPHVLNSLFDGLCDDVNLSLREFAGMCLAEFVRWSIKQVPNEHLEMQSNVHQLIRRIKHLALLPSTRKRVAAAVAFNHLYTILCEDNDIVSVYWLEMLHCFVRSMNGCDDPSITNALDHIERVIRYEADVLNATVQDRKKPPGFDGTTLNHALYWLLSQCGVLDEHCRAKCMELYINISQYAIGGSAHETTRIFVETYGIPQLNDIILKDLDSIGAFTSVDYLATLLKALDYYIWLIKKELLPLETLFPMYRGVRECIIFTCIKNFADQSWAVVSEEHMTTSTMKYRELEQLQTLRCKTLMAILNFVQMLLNIDNINVLPESLWVESLFALTIKCVMHPQMIGFDVKNIEMTDKLPHILETLLNAMKLRFNGTLMDIFKQHLFKSLEGYISQLYSLDDIAQNDSCKELIQHVKGLITLERCGILNLSEIDALAYREATIKQVFNFLVSERLEKFTCRDLSAHMIEYLQALMELQTLQHKTLITKMLLRFISISTPLIEDITHGKYFLNTFQDVIFEYILTNVDTITQLFDELSHNSAFLLELIENLLLYLQQHKLKLRVHVDSMVDVILRRFECLMDAANNVDSDMERLINIYGIAMHFVSRPIEIESKYKELYNWILRQLTNSCDIEHKTKILQNFLVCLVDTTGRVETKPEIVAILHMLKTNRETLCPQLSVKMNVNAMKVINCFEMLLRLLSTSRSIVILECVIHFTIGTGDRLSDNKLQDHLRQYYCREKIDIEHVSRSLDATYRLFMGTTLNVEQRLDILDRFLLPVFEFCNSTVTERFFERNIREMCAIIRCVVDGDNDANCKRIIVSQIGCYKLIAIMFARVKPDKIVDANGTIVRNAGLNRVETGQELLQDLLRDSANVRTLNINLPDCQKIARLLYCSAYNCTLAIVNLKENEYSYCSAFVEYYSRNLYVWKRIVDCNEPYKIGQTFDKYPKTYETTVNIRSFSAVDDREKELGGQRRRRYSYIHSYDLSASTLNEDINAYDFNKSVLLPESAVASNSEPIMSVTLEKDCFNKHECMPYICSILNRVSSLRKKNIPVSEEPVTPDWLRCFVKGMQKEYPNATLFILKIITNTADTVFKPYARFMLSKIAGAVTDYLKTNKLNYIITDILEVLMDWPIDDDESTDNGKLQELFEILIDKVLINTFMDNTNIASKRVDNYNLSLISAMVKKWCSDLTVPTLLLREKIKHAPNAAVYLILVLLGETSMAREIMKGYIINFVLERLEDWEIPDETWLTCCECSGLYLKLLLESKKENDGKSGKSDWRMLNERILSILGLAKSSKYILKQVKGIKTLCQACPDVAEDYINLVVGIIAINRDLGKVYCLEIFALSIPRLKDAERIVSKLYSINLDSILMNRVSPCEKIALRIVCEVTTKISPANLLRYINLIISYIKDNTTEHRKLVYDALMSTYKKYSVNMSNDANVKTLLSICEQNLLLALLDPSQELQMHVLRFWTDETKFNTSRSKERLLAVLDMHSQCTSTDAYALLVPLLMLQLTSRSIDYNQKMFEPFNCAYENYKIPVSWRRRNLSHVTPMFIDTLASQMSYTLSQNVDHNGRTCKPSYHHDPAPDMLRLRATQDPQFSPTLVDDHDAANADLPTIFDNSLFNATEYDLTMIPSRQSQTVLCNKKFHRFLKSSNDVAKIAREQQMQKNAQHAEMMKQESIRQKSNVRLYRDYRIGDLPDIAIPHSSLIEPLQQLIKLDPLICKDITVSLVCSLIKDTMEKNDSDFYQLVIGSLKKILYNNQKNSTFNAAILEILLTLGVTDCNSKDIMRVSKENNLNVLGALFLERSLLTDEETSTDDNSLPTSSKRMKRDENDHQKMDKWAHLASLYKSLNDVDVVLSIFHEQSFDKYIQNAAVAEANGDWKQAKLMFENAYNRTTNSSSMSEHCLQGIFEAVNNMCEWVTVDDLVRNRMQENRVWNDAWQDWIIPYKCNAYVHTMRNIRNLTVIQEGLQNIQSSIDDCNNWEQMKLVAGEDLVIFQIDNPNKAINLLNELLDKTSEQWVTLNPLCTELGMRMLEKLQRLNDIDASLKVLTHINDRDLGSDKMTALLNLWSTKTPAPRDNLIQSNKLAAYRIYFSMNFRNTYDELILDDNMNLKKCGITSHIERVCYQLRLNTIDVALKQKHRYIAKNNLDYFLGQEPPPDDMQARLQLLRAKYYSLRADFETNARKKMRNYDLSWVKLHQLLQLEKIDPDIEIALYEHIGVLAVSIERLSRKDEFDDGMFQEGGLFGDIPLHTRGIQQFYNLDNMRQCLLEYSSHVLAISHDVVEASRNQIGEHYYSLARHYCDQLTSNARVENNIFQDFVLAVLKAMYHGYHEAMHYFPCVLQPRRLLSNETVQEIFTKECKVLPVWLFLRWRDLLFSHLSTSIANMIAPIIEKLAEIYPDPVAYTYHLAIERNPALLCNNRTLKKIRKLLGNKIDKIEQFLRAIQYVTQPELYLKYYLNEATKGLVEGKVTALDSLLQKVYPTAINENSPGPGNIYKKIAKYENTIRNLNLEDHDATKKDIQGIKQSLEQSLQQYMNKSKLKEYSPFLHKYLNGSIEIPGQYTGNREPTPQCHVKIMRVEPIVKIMQSLRKPIRISMIGDNGREYKFLVKFGEDLTIDHSLQQLYATMNRTLRNDLVCRQRRLAIDTYEVIPLSRSFGLIQWIENTKTLEEMVRFTLSKKETDRCENVYNEYVAWIADAKHSSKWIVDQYREATVKYNKSHVTEMMKHLVDQTKQSALRDTFTVISPSPESFVTLRRNFVASYATMCTAHWISGIGDRHLQNILVVVSSGRCLGIDFGHAFDVGVRGLIPELAPFRLTPQILGLLRPFIQKELLGIIMTHTMRALRDDKEPILACMNIFVHEPITRSSSIDDETARNDGEDTGTDSTWLSKRNIEVVTKKLNGIHPSFIMLEQLQKTHKEKYFVRYHAIVTGTDRPPEKRAAIGNRYLTPAEQVVCLLDQATDLNVLGRMYANWKPWL